MPVRLCPPNPRPQPLWDADNDEGIPVPEGVQEEGPDGKEPAWHISSATSPLSGFTAGSSERAGHGHGQGGQDTLISSGILVMEGGRKQGPKPQGPDVI